MIKVVASRILVDLRFPSTYPALSHPERSQEPPSSILNPIATLPPLLPPVTISAGGAQAGFSTVAASWNIFLYPKPRLPPQGPTDQGQMGAGMGVEAKEPGSHYHPPPNPFTHHREPLPSHTQTDIGTHHMPQSYTHGHSWRHKNHKLSLRKSTHP